MKNVKINSTRNFQDLEYIKVDRHKTNVIQNLTKNASQEHKSIGYGIDDLHIELLER